MYPDCRRLMHSSRPVWDFAPGPPRGMPGNVGPERYYVRMRPAWAREGDRPLVPTLATARTPAAAAPADAYTARHLSVLEGLHAVGKFGGGSYTASGGLHGVGASVVNALAVRLDVEVDREGHTWAASFRRGVTGEFAGPGPDADFTRKSGLRRLSRPGQASRVRRATGTRIRFWPDRQVFIKDARFSFDALTERARQTAYLVPGLTISIREEPAGSPDGTQADHERVKQAVFRFDGGISE